MKTDVPGWILIGASALLSMSITAQAKRRTASQYHRAIDQAAYGSAAVVGVGTLVAMGVNLLGQQLLSALLLYAGFVAAELTAFLLLRKQAVDADYIRRWAKSLAVWLPGAAVGLVLVYMSP